MTLEEVLDREKFRYQRMHDFVNNLGSEWFIFKYEDMIAGNFAALNDYLGFEVKADGEVPQLTVKAKVLRKKAADRSPAGRLLILSISFKTMSTFLKWKITIF